MRFGFRVCLVVSLAMVSAWSFEATADPCISGERYCQNSDTSSRSSTEPAYPNTQSSLDLNPAAVPTADQWGLEGIFYKGLPDLVIVHGIGRVGAAISPSNGEDTFFGNPSFERDQDYLNRHVDSDKYKSKKLAFGLAGALFDNGTDDLSHVAVSIGALARYNEDTHSVKPGGGLSAIVGPLSLGVSTSLDETRLGAETDGTGTIEPEETIKDTTLLYSVGLSLKTAAIDYSMLKLTPNQGLSPIKVQLFTGTILLQRWILTAAYRIENSDRPGYDSKTHALTVEPTKHNYFGGVQYAIFKHLQIGLFYDYYLLNEISGGLTVFL